MDYDFSSIRKGDVSPCLSPLKVDISKVGGEETDLIRPMPLTESAIVQIEAENNNPFKLQWDTNIVVHLKNELWKSLAYVGLNGRRSDIVRTDHPEMYFTIGRQFDILCE